MAVMADEPTRVEVEEALLNLNAHAKRQPHVMGRTQPSNWDVAHQRLDKAIDQWRTCPA